MRSLLRCYAVQISISVYRRVCTDDPTLEDVLLSAPDVVHPPIAPGGADDVALADIDRRSPVAGLYVRLERLFAQQVR